MEAWVVLDYITAGTFAILSVIASVLWIVERKETVMMHSVILARWFYGACIMSTLNTACLLFTLALCFAPREHSEEEFADIDSPSLLRAFEFFQFLDEPLSIICFFTILAYFIGFYHSIRDASIKKDKLEKLREGDDEGFDQTEEDTSVGLLSNKPKQVCAGTKCSEKIRNVWMLVPLAALFILWVLFFILLYAGFEFWINQSETSSSEIPDPEPTKWFLLYAFLDISIPILQWILWGLVSIVFGVYLIRMIILYCGKLRIGRFMRWSAPRVFFTPSVCFIASFCRLCTGVLLRFVMPYDPTSFLCIAIFLDAVPLALALLFFSKSSMAMLQVAQNRSSLTSADEGSPEIYRPLVEL